MIFSQGDFSHDFSLLLFLKLSRFFLFLIRSGGFQSDFFFFLLVDSSRPIGGFH